MFIKSSGECHDLLEGWEKIQLPALARRALRQSSPPRALLSWLDEGSLNLMGSGAIAAARSIPSTADW